MPGTGLYGHDLTVKDAHVKTAGIDLELVYKRLAAVKVFAIVVVDHVI